MKSALTRRTNNKRKGKNYEKQLPLKGHVYNMKYYFTKLKDLSTKKYTKGKQQHLTLNIANK